MNEAKETTSEMGQVSKEMGDTWPKILKYNYEKYGDSRRAMRYKHFGIWRPYTWKDYYHDVKYLALGLLSLGFKPGDRLLIVGDNSPEYYSAELAAQANHGISVGAYSDLNPEEIRYIAGNSETGFAMVEDQEQVDKVIQIKDDLPLLAKIIYWGYKGLAHYDDPALMGYRQVLELGKKFEEEHQGLFEKNVETGRADDPCALVYTSGTTGAKPKAAVHTFRTMRAGADYLLSLDPWDKRDNIVPYLPPAWMTEQWFGIGCHLLSACVLNFAEAPETQQRDTKETEPSIVFYGARLWESQAAMIRARMLWAYGLKRLVSRLFMPVGYRMADLRFQRKKPGLFQSMLYGLADITLFRSIRKSLGLSNARICYSTGAILSPDAFRFYHALNLPLKSLYASTEGGILAMAGNDDIRLDAIGPVHEGAKVRINEQGEIVSKQTGVFVGYFKDGTKTAEVLKDGWFHSGDSGFIAEDGHLVFVDRAKDLVELAGGGKLAPQFVESRLRSSPYIKDAWILVGPQGDYASAILIIDYDTVGRWAGQRKIAYNTFAELSQRPEVYALLEQDIDRINSALPSDSRVRKYVNLHKEFDPDKGELTRTRQLRKIFLEEKYHELIDAIYGDKSEVPMKVRVRHRDGRTETLKTTIRIKSVEGVVR